MIYLVVSQSTHVRASLAPITGSTSTYYSLAVLLDLGQFFDCAIRSRPEQAYSRRGCVFVCLVCGGVCYMLDTLILTPSMRLFVPGFRQNLLTSRHPGAFASIFQPISLSISCPFHSIADSLYRAAISGLANGAA